MKKNSLAFGLVVLLIAVFAVTTYNTLTSQDTVVAGARVAANANIGVYSDSRCRKPVSAIDWGDLKQGDTKTFTVYVKNIGTSKVTLTLGANNWSSAAADQSIGISWNREKTVLAASRVVQATLKLTVSQSVNSKLDTFSFIIRITGTA